MFSNPLSSRAHLHAVLLAAAIALAACAGSSQKWTKAGVGEETMAADFDQCDFVGQAAGLSAINRADDTFIRVSPSGQLIRSQLPGVSALGFMKQADAFARCMEARGYRRTTSQ